MKYRLKQWYPFLPEEWKDQEIVIEEHSTRLHCYGNRDNNPNKQIPSYQVENNPEYWKPVEEKQYKILSFRYGGVSLSTKNFTEDFTGDDKWNIYSVKRLSDEEVFTVGDKVKHNGYSFTVKKIDFGEVHDKNIFLYEDNHLCANLESVHHVKEPVFTTEDGMDIYEDDWYYYVTEKYQIGERQCPYYSHDDNFLATFSTKEKAQQYIDKHKPQYSKADIENAIIKIDVEPKQNVHIYFDKFWEELNE